MGAGRAVVEAKIKEEISPPARSTELETQRDGEQLLDRTYHTKPSALFFVLRINNKNFPISRGIFCQRFLSVLSASLGRYSGRAVKTSADPFVVDFIGPS